MSRTIKILVAALAVFAGSLVADIAFGDGIQDNDFQQAMMVAVIAGVVQSWLVRRNKPTK